MVSSARCSPAFPRVLKGLRLAAEEVTEGCDFRAGRHPLPLNNLPGGDRVRGRWSGRGTGSSRPDRALVSDPAGSGRLVLEVLLWPVGRYGEQGVMLHVCSKAFQRRPFRMTSSEVGARRALGPSVALGVIPPLCATLGPVLAGPEGCSRGRWRSGPSKWRHTAAPEGRGQGAPRTCRCIETSYSSLLKARATVREHHAPVGALRLAVDGAQACQLAVREHHAPVGALRLLGSSPVVPIPASGSTTHL